MAIPLGLAMLGSLSATVGNPAESEKRTVTGVEFRVAWGARVSEAALDPGVNVPVHRIPFAWAGRYPGCKPETVSSACSKS